LNARAHARARCPPVCGSTATIRKATIRKGRIRKGRIRKGRSGAADDGLAMGIRAIIDGRSVRDADLMGVHTGFEGPSTG
jgi:hypothetical protein